MIWPGMGDPTKRKKTIRFLIITAILGISTAAIASFIFAQFALSDPLKVCINDKNTPFKISATLEIFVDGEKAYIPSNVGFEEGGCQKSIYTLSDDGTIYAEWVEEYPYEIGHFLWMFKFPLRDMEQSKSKIYVNDRESEQFISTPWQDGYHYKGMFVSKAYDESKDTDFLPPEQ